MRFLVDAQLPPAFARWLAAQGHEAEHVSDCGLARAADPEVWDYATSVDAIIVSKDEDFARRKVLDREGPRVVWIRLPNTRRRELIVWFERMLPRLLQALERGETLIEII
jgi:predicted nuclease of predicted toxin-antitoxin system